MMAFMIWMFIAVCFLLLGVYCFHAKKAVRFWANDEEAIVVKNIRAYNKAMGKLWTWAGIFFGLLGLPFVLKQNSPLSIVSILGCLPWVIIVMLWGMRIEDKYRQ